MCARSQGVDDDMRFSSTRGLYSQHFYPCLERRGFFLSFCVPFCLLSSQSQFSRVVWSTLTFFPSPVSQCRGSSPEIPRSDPVSSGDKSKSSGE